MVPGLQVSGIPPLAGQSPRIREFALPYLPAAFFILDLELYDAMRIEIMEVCHGSLDRHVGFLVELLPSVMSFHGDREQQAAYNGNYHQRRLFHPHVTL